MSLPKRVKRIDAQSIVPVECSQCSKRNKKIRANCPFAIVVKWDDVWVNTQTGREYSNEYEGELIVEVHLEYAPSPHVEVTAILNQVASCIIFNEPDAWQLKTPSTVTIHHLNGCGVVTRRYWRRMHGSAGSKQ